MEPNKESKKPRISYRYYELPEGELVQAITGDDWVCTYGTYAEDVHFHNVMEIGICRWGQGFMVLEDRRIDYTDGAITVVPANCLHTTLSKDKSLNSWEYLFFDPQGILNSAFPNDPLFVETVLHRLSSQTLCLPKEDAVELEKLNHHGAARMPEQAGIPQSGGAESDGLTASPDCTNTHGKEKQYPSDDGWIAADHACDRAYWSALYESDLRGRTCFHLFFE